MVQANVAVGQLQRPRYLLFFLAAALGLALLLGAASAMMPLMLAKLMLGSVAALVFVLRPRWLLFTWAVVAMFGDLRIDQQTSFGALTYVSLPCFALTLFRNLP